MKADNEPTISLPVYFFLPKKQKDQNKTKIKVSNGESPTPDLWRGRSARYLLHHDN